MRELEMHNGEVLDADRMIPWCPECECYSGPEHGVCADCGAEVMLKRADE
jgi:rRNA maturation endonuclease Nob1